MRSTLGSAVSAFAVLALASGCSRAKPATSARDHGADLRRLFRYMLPPGDSAPLVVTDSAGGIVYAVQSDDGALTAGRLDAQGRPRWRVAVARRSAPAGVCLRSTGDVLVVASSGAPEGVLVSALSDSGGAVKSLERFPKHYASIEGLSANDVQTVLLLRVSGWVEVGGRRLENSTARPDSIPATGALALAVMGAGGTTDFAWLPNAPRHAAIGATDSGFVVGVESPPAFPLGQGPNLAADARLIAFDTAGRQRWDRAVSGAFGLAAAGGGELALLVPTYAEQGPVNTYPPPLVALSLVRVHDGTLSAPRPVWRRDVGSVLGKLAPDRATAQTPSTGARCSSDGPLQANRRGEVLLELPRVAARESPHFVLVDRDGRPGFEHRCTVDATDCTLSLGDDGSLFESGFVEGRGSYVARVR